MDRRLSLIPQHQCSPALQESSEQALRDEWGNDYQQRLLFH